MIKNWRECKNFIIFATNIIIVIEYKIGLSLIPKIGAVSAKKLIAYCGSAEAVFKEKEKFLLKIPGIGKAMSKEVINQSIIDRALEEKLFIEEKKITPLFFLDEAYPKRLKHCVDSPVMLYYKGNADLNNRKTIAIVGTRNATDYGKQTCQDLVRGIVKHNPLIVSGLAYGIDVAAHKAALDNSLKTVGVLAHGLDRIYPPLHKDIAKKMVSNGGLLTEFMQKTTPDRENFPKRNRIVAGMVDAVIVIESGVKGGALITADIANSYNRDVFAIPGKINDAFSKGCNFLIKTHRAALLEKPADLEYIMGWETSPENKKPKQRELFIELNEEETKIVDILKKEENLGIDTLCLKAAMPMSKVSPVLLSLEFEGIVKSLPGKRYTLV